MKLSSVPTGESQAEPMPSLPRIPAPTIQRERIGNWIEVLAGGSMRLMVAPPGYGKTTILLHIAHAHPAGTVYVRCSSGRTLSESLSAALGERIERTELVRRLEDFEAVLLDDLEQLETQDEHLLDRIVQNPRIRNVLGATSRTTVVKSEHVASGLVSVCSARLLAFECAEIEALARALGLNLTELDALDLLERCEGWPIAVTAALRNARAFKTSPAIALQYWKMDQRAVVLDMLEEHLTRLPATARNTWRSLIAGARVPEVDALELEACGAPLVYRENIGYVPLRVVADMYARRTMGTDVRSTMSVRMFGTFECSIDGVHMTWLRRMDRRLFRYLLLTKDGFESREAILERFWPGLDTSASVQSLRTTCSNIKKAIANLTGGDGVADYFTSGERLCVNLDNINVDVRRFISHIRAANLHLATEAWEDALYHNRQADAIYTAHLGWGDEPEAWLESLDRECRTMRMDAMRTTISVLKRLGRTDEANGDEMLLAERAKRHR